MADVLEQTLKDYFSGKLDIEIKLRESDLGNALRYEKNTGGSHPKNNISRNEEQQVISKEDDVKLSLLKREKFVIENVFNLQPERHQKLLINRYKHGMPWVQICKAAHIGDSAAFDWKNKFKKEVAAMLYD